jgi:cystathionine beta-lyase/cystathionine gamma-synthase
LLILIDGYRNAVKPNTKLLYAETPANPICAVIDLAELGKLAREHNALTVVDSTFASPINQNPIKDFGIDVSTCLLPVTDARTTREWWPWPWAYTLSYV